MSFDNRMRVLGSVFGLMLLGSTLVLLWSSASNSKAAKPAAWQVLPVEPGAMVGIVGATGALKLDAQGIWSIKEPDRLVVLGQIRTNTQVVKLPLDGTLLQVADLEKHMGQAVTIVADVEYDRDDMEVSRPARVLRMAVFFHLDGLPKAN